ncbi:hypothetical protein CRG98_038260 [Punica granatum]|uniref:Vacuolar protein sorting-associated protein 62 n=1 Tax=Punica granatum TaxID=22663 RepID=A0A2I0IBJ8_PUNGR|nr:hypothetical protein CRG98_038260 [Punica granatum]
MFGCECFCWDRVTAFEPTELGTEPFSLPSALPEWPQGRGFATGRIRLGELEVLKITKFESVWTFNQTHGKPKITFYRPEGTPDGFHCLGYYCQSNEKPLIGYVLVARDALELSVPALRKPVGYTPLWAGDAGPLYGPGYFWLPSAPSGYRPMGIVVTTEPEEPDLEEVRCVREDLTEHCEACNLKCSGDSRNLKLPFEIWNTRPCNRGIWERGVPVGTFICCSRSGSSEPLDIGCLKNCDDSLHAMPNLDQIHALISHYGPTVFFHPDEVYLPSSVQWFFQNGALLCQDGESRKQPIDSNGSCLPQGGSNDGKFWINLPKDEELRNFLKRGNIESAELYVHVKPALGGSFTDIAMWVFCPFNGPVTLKVGLMSFPMTRIGEHVGDWEHFTLRVSNFTGELWGMYFSQHSGGEWVHASDLEFIDGNRPIVYSSKSGHASFANPGLYLQGSSRLGIGVRNDAARSRFFVDSSRKYKIVSAEYLGDGIIAEPCWLQYMREWGPTIMYDARAELDKVINRLPYFVRFSVENIFDLFPTELYGEEGPTGPKGKDNWEGDERC